MSDEHEVPVEHEDESVVSPSVSDEASEGEVPPPEAPSDEAPIDGEDGPAPIEDEGLGDVAPIEDPSPLIVDAPELIVDVPEVEEIEEIAAPVDEHPTVETVVDAEPRVQPSQPSADGQVTVLALTTEDEQGRRCTTTADGTFIQI